MPASRQKADLAGARKFYDAANAELLEGQAANRKVKGRINRVLKEADPERVGLLPERQRSLTDSLHAKAAFDIAHRLGIEPQPGGQVLHICNLLWRIDLNRQK